MALSDNLLSHKRLTVSDVVLAFVIISVSVVVIVLQTKNTGNSKLKAVVKKTVLPYSLLCLKGQNRMRCVLMMSTILYYT